MRTCKGQPTQPNVHTHLWSITKSIKKFSPVVFAFFPKQPHFRAGGRSATGAQSELLKALLGSARLDSLVPGIHFQERFCISAPAAKATLISCVPSQPPRLLSASCSSLGKQRLSQQEWRKAPFSWNQPEGGPRIQGGQARRGGAARSSAPSENLAASASSDRQGLTRRSLMRQHFYLVTCNPGQFRILFWFLPLIFSWVWCLGIRQMSHPPRARITTGPRNRFTHASSDGTKGQFVD